MYVLASESVGHVMKEGSFFTMHALQCHLLGFLLASLCGDILPVFSIPAKPIDFYLRYLWVSY